MDFYSERLLPIIKKTTAVIEQTPHMQDILHGTMPLERFSYQIRQNYQYLLDFTRAWAVGLSRARNFDEMMDWYRIVTNTMEEAVIPNRQKWAQYLKIPLPDLDQVIMAPGKRSYTSHELARAMEGDLASCLMALFPCNILYWHMGQDLISQCILPAGNMYREWIEYYVSPSYAGKCEDQIRMVNELCGHKSSQEQDGLQTIFAIGCNYEILQWRDMYYEMEEWPLMEIFPSGREEGQDAP